jgi:hypothetical protein
MNAGLKACDTVTVVPIFFAFYSILALFNSNVYYDQWRKYNGLNYGIMIPSIVILTAGVYILSASQVPDGSGVDGVVLDSPLSSGMVGDKKVPLVASGGGDGVDTAVMDTS